MSVRTGRSTLRLATPWRLAFANLDHAAQGERIRYLARLGWSEARIVDLSGWHVNDVRRVLGEVKP